MPITHNLFNCNVWRENTFSGNSRYAYLHSFSKHYLNVIKEKKVGWKTERFSEKKSVLKDRLRFYATQNEFIALRHV